jgi:hypothetical protein
MMDGPIKENALHGLTKSSASRREWAISYKLEIVPTFTIILTAHQKKSTLRLLSINAEA